MSTNTRCINCDNVGHCDPKCDCASRDLRQIPDKFIEHFRRRLSQRNGPATQSTMWCDSCRHQAEREASEPTRAEMGCVCCGLRSKLRNIPPQILQHPTKLVLGGNKFIAPVKVASDLDKVAQVLATSDLSNIPESYTTNPYKICDKCRRNTVRLITNTAAQTLERSIYRRRERWLRNNGNNDNDDDGNNDNHDGNNDNHDGNKTSEDEEEDHEMGDAEVDIEGAAFATNLISAANVGSVDLSLRLGPNSIPLNTLKARNPKVKDSVVIVESSVLDEKVKKKITRQRRLAPTPKKLHPPQGNNIRNHGGGNINRHNLRRKPTNEFVPHVPPENYAPPTLNCMVSVRYLLSMWAVIMLFGCAVCGSRMDRTRDEIQERMISGDYYSELGHTVYHQTWQCSGCSATHTFSSCDYSRNHPTFVFSPTTVSSMAGAMMTGMRYGEFVKQQVAKGLGVPSVDDWNRVEIAFVASTTRLFHRMLDRAWEVIAERDENALGGWSMLYLGADGFWQQRPKKNHAGSSNHGSFIVWDMISNLIVWCGTVSKEDDPLFGIPGINITSQSMESYLFQTFLAHLVATGATLAFLCKDGDVGAATILYLMLGQVGVKLPCWMHKLRTMWNKIKTCGANIANNVPDRSKESKEACSCPAHATEKQKIKHIKPNGTFASMVQATITRAFTIVTNEMPRYNRQGVLNPKWPGIAKVREMIIKEITLGINHLFDLNHDHCEHAANPKIRSSHYCTCTLCHSKIWKIINDTLQLLKPIDECSLWNNETGLGVTNAGESAIGKIATIRVKNFAYSAAENRAKVMLGCVFVQALRLFLFTGEMICPEVEILQDLERDFEFGPNSLIGEYQKEFYEREMKRKAKRAEQEKTPEWRKKTRENAASRRMEKELSKKETVASPSYNNDHTEAFNDADIKERDTLMKKENNAAMNRIKHQVQQDINQGIAIVPQKKKKAARKCGYCKLPGHTARTCLAKQSFDRTQVLQQSQQSQTQSTKKKKKTCQKKIKK